MSKIPDLKCWRCVNNRKPDQVENILDTDRWKSLNNNSVENINKHEK